MVKLWLAILCGFFSLGVDDPAADPQADLELDLTGSDPAPAPPGDPDPEPDPAPEPDPKALLAEERAARQRDSENHQRELAEARRNSAPAPQSEDQRLFEEEEKRLKAPDITDLERWQINSNRQIRASKSFATSALTQAQELADRTSFRQLEVTKPALYKRYEARVEEELSKMRAKGQSAPREAILRFLIGNDAIEGKLSTKKKASAPAAPAQGAVPRGRTPGARSDVAGRNAQSEHEKRRARLENVNI